MPRALVRVRYSTIKILSHFLKWMPDCSISFNDGKICYSLYKDIKEPYYMFTHEEEYIGNVEGDLSPVAIKSIAFLDVLNTAMESYETALLEVTEEDKDEIPNVSIHLIFDDDDHDYDSSESDDDSDRKLVIDKEEENAKVFVPDDQRVFTITFRAVEGLLVDVDSALSEKKVQMAIIENNELTQAFDILKGLNIPDDVMIGMTTNGSKLVFRTEPDDEKDDYISHMSLSIPFKGPKIGTETYSAYLLNSLCRASPGLSYPTINLYVDDDYVFFIEGRNVGERFAQTRLIIGPAAGLGMEVYKKKIKKKNSKKKDKDNEKEFIRKISKKEKLRAKKEKLRAKKEKKEVEKDTRKKKKLRKKTVTKTEARRLEHNGDLDDED
jgi:hypothetical protein